MRPALVALLLGLVGALALVATIAWPGGVVGHREIGVVLDRSRSSRPASLCADVYAAVEDALLPHAGHGVRWFATGTAASAWEPTRVGRWSLPVERRLIHGASAVARPWAGACEAVEPATETPLFRAVLAALDELRAVRGEHVDRVLLVRSDLLEEEDATLVARLVAGPGKGRAPLPPRLDNEGVLVHFCGVTQRDLRPGSKVASAAALQAAWRAELTEPGTARFSAGCP